MSIVFTEDRGAVRHVVLNRAHKRNAMNHELLRALRESLRDAASDEAVHCVVLRGEGPVFSAGVDLVELGQSAGRVGMLRPFREVFLDCANICEEMTKPVVCEIQRACIGGALEVALGCDLRVASSDAQLGLPEVRFGLIPDVGGSTRLPAVVGLGRAKEMIMTARLLDAREALRIGLVNRVVPAEELARATQELVDELLANSPIAVGRAKRVLDASARPALAQTLELEISVQEYCIAAATLAAGAAATAGAGAADAGAGAGAAGVGAGAGAAGVGAAGAGAGAAGVGAAGAGAAGAGAAGVGPASDGAGAGGAGVGADGASERDSERADAIADALREQAPSAALQHSHEQDALPGEQPVPAREQRRFVTS